MCSTKLLQNPFYIKKIYIKKTKAKRRGETPSETREEKWNK
jgi:hypothetical protein